MAISFKSRFAVLKIEDDEDEVEEKKQCPMRANQNSNPTAVKKKIKKKPVEEEKDDSEAELQKLAFVTVKSKKKASASKSTSAIKKPVSSEQWEDWKKRDKNYVANSFEQDLKSAILLSKLEHEKKQEVVDKQQQNAASAKNNKKVANKKKDKPPPLSLSQFNSLNPSQIANFTKENSVEVQTPPKVLPPPNETDFWDKVVEDTENVLCQEKLAHKRKSGPNAARALQYQDEIEKRDKEIESLTLELDSLRNELLTVKTRNKKLCNILGQGEMREKAEILVQVDQITKVKDELTQEVTELHAALEQERSKVHNLQTEVKKYQAARKN